jgi:hypothetical protein
MSFLLDGFYDQEQHLWKHTYKNGVAKIDAFLDDLAFLCQASLDMYEPTGDFYYLEQSISLINYINKHYSDEEKLHYYFTPDFQSDILVRKKDLYDGAVPSGNAVMASNLRRLGMLTGDSSFTSRSEQMLVFIKDQCVRYPLSNGYWAKTIIEQIHGINEIVLVGENAQKASFGLLRKFLPNKVIMSSEMPSDLYPMLKGKPSGNQLLYYLCKDYACKAPYQSEEALLSELLRGNQP